MIKSKYFPDKIFSSKNELFKSLKSNEDNIIEFKKAHIYKGCEKAETIGQAVFNDDVIKSIGFKVEKNYIYPIISTTKYMDSHDDVHLDGCFTKTVKDQQGKVYYCADHDLSLNGIIAGKNHVKMMVKNIDWSYVGKDYEGQTQALIFAIDKSNIKKKDALELIDSDPELENSIRMQYIKIVMGIDSDEKEYKENKIYFDSRINDIANKEYAKEKGYFFGVEELKIHKEGSLVIAGGSNDATRIYQEIQITEATSSTSDKIEPSNDTQKREKTDYSKIKFHIK